MIGRSIAIAAAAALTSVAACAQSTSPSESAFRENAVETTATVEQVDRESREVTLRTADGRTVTLALGPEVRNFDQIETGDTVRAVYVESVAAEMAAVDDSGETEAAGAVVRAPEGERPGAVAGAEVSTVVTFESFDPATDTVTFVTEDGQTHSLVVHPAMRDFAMRREAGDRVRVTFTEAVAIVVEETEG